ncbi:MAG: GMC family oxidoreductase [Elusimicrobia bacterium]|nr:GMC family oxidoreductase [Elusimicrobiota bacterium]
MLVFSRKQTDFFLLAAGRIVPETSRLGAVGQGRFLEIVDNALVKRPSSTLRQLRLFLLAMRFLPILRYGRTFAGLAGQQQDSFLKWLESCPIRLLRTGEWGPKFREEEFTGQELEMAQRLYFDGGGFLTKDKSMTLAFARAYGGSTVVYTGTSLVIRPQTVRTWNVPGLFWEDISRRAQKYKSENNVRLLEDELINDNNRLFFEGCKKLGYRAEQFPLNIKGCQGSGMCNMGCPNQAKQGTHRVQLVKAERLGVQVITRCEAIKINIQNRVVEAIVYPPVGAGLPSSWQAGSYHVRAKALVLSAGAVGSPALLLRGGLGRCLPALGRYFTAHPALILAAQHDRSITNYFGHPKSYFSDHFAESHKFLLETCMYFPFVTAKNLAGFGPQHSLMMSAMDRLQMILVMALDQALARNRVTLDSRGRPVVDYKITQEVIGSFTAAMKASCRIFFAAGARRVHAPSAGKFLIEREDEGRLDELIKAENFQLGRVSITSAHLMGGCRMGAGPGDSVTDSWGQVHGLPWLFAADASLFPKCAEINPYLTIMALADRAAQKIRERIGNL